MFLFRARIVQAWAGSSGFWVLSFCLWLCRWFSLGGTSSSDPDHSCIQRHYDAKHKWGFSLHQIGLKNNNDLALKCSEKNTFSNSLHNSSPFSPSTFLFCSLASLINPIPSPYNLPLLCTYSPSLSNRTVPYMYIHTYIHTYTHTGVRT